MNMQKELLSALEKEKFQSRIVSIHHLAELKEEIEEKHRQRLFDKEFYRERLIWFKFRPPKSLASARSLIVLAYPQPQICILFKWKGKSYSILLPPTYLHYPNQIAESLLKEILKPRGYSIAKTSLPLKLLAVRSGLGSFGKNNICYVPGLGSFHRLMAFYSDFPAEGDSWSESKMMESCQKCSACLHACLTKAIVSERFLLHAEKCLTFHNERARDFPAWIDPSWHHCIFGCMQCQKVCPQNKKFMNWVEDREEFSEEETDLILKGTSSDSFPSSIRQKIERLSLMEDSNLIPRNLRVLL